MEAQDAGDKTQEERGEGIGATEKDRWNAGWRQCDSGCHHERSRYWYVFVSWIYAQSVSLRLIVAQLPGRANICLMTDWQNVGFN